MPHTLLEKTTLAPKVIRYRILAPEIARKRQAGQFVILRLNADGERFPLTLVDSDPKEGSITLIVQETGPSTLLMGRLKVGEAIRDILGPLGHPTEIAAYGTCVCVAGGIGAAPLYPIARALKAAGNRVITILGARTAGLMILENELRAASDELLPTTDDGSRGARGFVSDVLKGLIDRGEKLDCVVAIGPVPMMRAVSEVTRGPGIRTIVSLNPIMVDGTGMCGGCRVRVGGETRFACVDGPEFDGHRVDFGALISRLKMYDHLKPCALEAALAQAGETRP